MNDLLKDNVALQEKVLNLTNEIKVLKSEVRRWKALAEALPDNDDNNELRRINEKLERQVIKLESEREVLLYKVSNLEELKRENKEEITQLRKEIGKRK